jgi:hypothetical protein
MDSLLAPRRSSRATTLCGPSKTGTTEDGLAASRAIS